MEKTTIGDVLGCGSNQKYVFFGWAGTCKNQWKKQRLKIIPRICLFLENQSCKPFFYGFLMPLGTEYLFGPRWYSVLHTCLRCPKMFQKLDISFVQYSAVNNAALCLRGCVYMSFVSQKTYLSPLGNCFLFGFPTKKTKN